jgi:hypothetical protein
MENPTEKALVLLKDIFKKWAICLVEVVEYSAEKKTMKAKMKASSAINNCYRKRPEEITGLNYILAISQLVYVFIDFLINEGSVELLTEQEMTNLIDGKKLPWYLRRYLKKKKNHADRQEYLFEILMGKYKLKFRHVEIDFKKIVKITDFFEVEMSLASSRRTKIGVPLVITKLSGPYLEGEIVNIAILA